MKYGAAIFPLSLCIASFTGLGTAASTLFPPAFVLQPVVSGPFQPLSLAGSNVFGTSIAPAFTPAVFSPSLVEGAIEIISGGGAGGPKLLALVTNAIPNGPATLEAVDAEFQNGEWHVHQTIGKFIFWSGWTTAIVNGRLVLRIANPPSITGWGLQPGAGRDIIVYNVFEAPRIDLEVVPRLG